MREDPVKPAMRRVREQGSRIRETLGNPYPSPFQGEDRGFEPLRGYHFRPVSPLFSVVSLSLSLSSPAPGDTLGTPFGPGMNHATTPADFRPITGEEKP